MSVTPPRIISMPRGIAAPPEAPTIKRPTQIWRTPKQKTKTLFQNGGSYFSILPLGKLFKPFTLKFF